MKHLLHLAFAATFLASFAVAPAQSLLLSTQGTAAAGAAVDQNWTGGDILVYDPAVGAARTFLPMAGLTVLVGDGNGNGHYDDGPDGVDAIAHPSAAITAAVFPALVSFTKTVRFADGTTVKDGDVVALMPGGGVSVMYPESLFTAVTGTTTIDIDAFHVLSDGTLIFSFDADETTSLGVLTQQNGGNPTLDETIVFALPPGAATASILYTRSQILGFVNNALGTSFSTVVDTVAITEDPVHPGEYLFAVGSTNSTIEGIIFSTFAGGQVAQLGGQPLDSPSFGFADQEVLSALDFQGSPTPAPPFVLYPPDPALIGAIGIAAFHGAGAAAFQPLRLGVAVSTFPGPATAMLSVFAAPGWVFVNTSDPFLGTSLTSNAFLALTDGAGRADWFFSMTGVPPGIAVTVQAFEIASLRLSNPVSFET